MASAQAIGGPVGTSVMGSWMCTPGAKKNRGLIFGTWTTHQ
jgi:OPA family glycerol-3-phosphate transporter-like MFS transporter 1/2